MLELLLPPPPPQTHELKARPVLDNHDDEEDEGEDEDVDADVASRNREEGEKFPKTGLECPPKYARTTLYPNRSLNQSL